MTTRSPADDRVLVTGRLQVGAMVVGLVVVALVGKAIHPFSGRPDPTLEKGLLLTWLGLGVALGLVYPWLAGPLLAKQRGRPYGSDAIAQLYLKWTLLRAALAEGYGLFSAVAFWVTNNALFLVGAVLAGVFLVRVFPTAKGLRWFAESARVEP